MNDKINVELDESFIKKLYALTDTLPPDMHEVNLQVLKKQILGVEQNFNSLNEEIEKLKVKPSGLRPRSKPKMEDTQEGSSPTKKTSKEGHSSSDSEQQSQLISPESQQNEEGHVPHKGRVFVIDDLGVITFQLEILFKKMGYSVTASKEIYDAIEKFKRNVFDFVIMDLFIPTEREGFILLDELTKIVENKNLETVIGVMTASTRKEHKVMCANKGAEFYVEKLDDWQKEIFKLFENFDKKRNS